LVVVLKQWKNDYSHEDILQLVNPLYHVSSFRHAFQKDRVGLPLKHELTKKPMQAPPVYIEAGRKTVVPGRPPKRRRKSNPIIGGQYVFSNTIFATEINKIDNDEQIFEEIFEDIVDDEEQKIGVSQTNMV
jgi:hypothetical protein